MEPIGSVCVLRIDREAKRNALTVAILASIRQALDNAMSARAIVLSGVGDIFCSGFDLPACRDDDRVLPDLLVALQAACQAMREHPAPVVVSAHGAAIAGGCALVAAADFSYTTHDARIGYPAVRLGISPAVSAPLLRLAVGDGHARERLIDPGVIDGREALRLGLVADSLPSTSRCQARAIETARALAEHPPHAIAHTKRWLNRIDGSDNPGTATAAVEASLSVAGSDEQRAMLALALSPRTQP